MPEVCLKACEIVEIDDRDVFVVGLHGRKKFIVAPNEEVRFPMSNGGPAFPVAGEITRPWYALGGINESNIAQVLDAGAVRVAVSSALSAASSPADAARALKDALVSRLR